MKCRCNQEEKAVVLVGCTQNGKSSLIRTILRYGGYMKEAAAVEIGIGNKSTTKYVSSHKVAINIRSHELNDEEGNAVPFVDEDTDIYDLAPESYQSGRHVHLLLVDTPGLDDSDNVDHEEREGGGPKVASSGPQMRSVDEMHKLAVLRALAGMENVHSVCFVLSLENTLGSSTQALTREYLEIFRKSQIDASYHFVHTFVNIENMFGNKARKRPEIIEKAFGFVPSQTTHHHVNNMAMDDDPIDQHFADVAITSLLESITKDIGQPTSHLRYPKSHIHKLLGSYLIQSIDVLERSFHDEISSIEAKISKLNASKLLHEPKRNTQRDAWSELNDKVTKIDTAELVKIGYERMEARGSPFAVKGSDLNFSVSAKKRIRQVDLDETPGHKSGWVGPFMAPNKMSCTAVLSAPRGKPIWGTVTLWGWKKDVCADELGVLQRELDEAWKELKATESSIRTIDSEISRCMEAIEELRKKTEQLEEDKAYLKLDYIPIEKVQANAAYFGAPDVLCYSLGHGLKQTMPTRLLPESTMASAKHVKDWFGRENQMASLKAARMLKKLLESDELAIGVYTIVRMGMEDCGEESVEVWQRLLHSLRRVHNCNPNRFDEVF
jgi:GTPase SAR1 family protein